MTPETVIHNPFVDQATIPVVSSNGHATEPSMDDLFKAEVDSAAVAEITKRNMAPAGTYVTDPDNYPPTITASFKEEQTPPRLQPEVAASGVPPTKRVMANVFARATATIKGDEVTQVLRFSLSPEARHKKIYDGNTWTGEYDEKKDDIATRLWANAVTCYEDFHGKGTKFTQQDVLDLLKAVPVAIRTMQGDRGELVVLSISSRRGKSRG